MAAGAFGAAVQAEYRRGQALGTIYVDRKEIRHGTIDSMSRDEVLRKLQELKKLYGSESAVIDVTPEPVQVSLEKQTYVEKARDDSLSEAKGESTEVPHNEN